MPERKPKLSQEQLKIRKFVNEGRKALKEMEVKLETAKENFWEQEDGCQNICAGIGHIWTSRTAYDETYPYTEHFCNVCGIEANDHNNRIKEKSYPAEILKKVTKFVFPKNKEITK
jgi:hypothetical protein